MTQSPITLFRLSGHVLAAPLQGGQAWATSRFPGSSPRGGLTPCLGLAVLGSTVLWATIVSIGTLLIA